MGESVGLKQMILNKLDGDSKLAKEVCGLSGYSSVSAFKKNLRNQEGDIEKFTGFVRVVHELFPTDKFKLMTRFARTINPKHLTARFMLEYLSVYRNNDTKEYLIKQMLDSDNEESREWAFVYDIDHRQAKGELGSYDAIDMLSQKKYNYLETKIFSKMLMIYFLEDFSNYKMMNKLRDEIIEEINKIKKDFIKNSYYARLLLIENTVNLHSNRTSKIKENLFMIEDALDPIKSMTYLAVANSYIISNYQKAKELFIKALEISNEFSRIEIMKSLNFLYIIWDKFELYEIGEDISNDLFFYAKSGNKEKGIEILNRINVEELTDRQKGFNYYYQSLLFNDRTLLFKSIAFFSKSEEKYFKQLPIMELKKYNEESCVLEALMA